MNTQHAPRLLVAAIASLLLACSGGGAGDARNHWDLKMGPPADMTMGPPPYPMGPYGNQLGNTMANIKLSGYRLSVAQTDSSQLTWDSTISLSDFHNNPACTCMVFSVGATWCPACQQEQGGLTGDLQGGGTLCALGVLQEGPQNGTPATMQDVTDWTQQYHQDFPVVMGTQQTEALFNGWASGNPPTIGLPFNLVIQTSTMHVVDEVEGYDPAIASKAMTACGGQ